MGIAFTVNGAAKTVDVADTTSLLETLRNHLGLMGARYGCGAGQCGACAVLVDGRLEAACHTPLEAVEGKAVTTVEGLGTPDAPHPLQEAFIELQAGQCGYCLSGILVSAKALFDRNPDPSRTEIAQALDWHLCRCGVHNRVIAAVTLAAQRLREGAHA